MRRTRLALLSGILIVLTACGDSATDPTPRADRVGPAVEPMAEGCISAAEISNLIGEVFASNSNNKSAALSRWNQTLRALERRPETAQGHALQLVDYLLNKFFDGQLVGGTSLATRLKLARLLNGILCTVGLPPLDPGVLDVDGAAQVVEPNSGTTTIVTGTEWAGVVIPAGAVNQTTLITIRRLPDFPGPLLTQFDQYPLFYEFDYTPGTTFSTDVTIGTCLANGYTPPDAGRLRVAHNVAPFTMGSIEILPLVAAPFVECSDAGELATEGSRWGLDLALGGMLMDAARRLVLPRELEAATRRRGGAGVGGTVRTFSPFGLIDTLGVLEQLPAGTSALFGTAVSPAPSVRLVTPTGRPISGITTRWTIIGGGKLTHSTPVSGPDGVAALGSWVLGFTEYQELVVKATAPPRTGFLNNHASFVATGIAP